MKVVEVLWKSLKCEQCDFRFTDAKNIPRHMLLKHSKLIRKLQCIHWIYQNKANYDDHYKINSFEAFFDVYEARKCDRER